MRDEEAALLARLYQLDDAVDVDVTSSEADFLELVCFRQHGKMTLEQRQYAKKLLRKYDF